MLPVVSGRAATRRQILIYTLLLVPLTLGPAVMGFAGPLYGLAAAVLGGVFVAGAVRLQRWVLLLGCLEERFRDDDEIARFERRVRRVAVSA